MNLFSELQDNLSSYDERIKTLKGIWDEDDVDKLDKGVKECLSKINENAKSFIVYGEPQSGKTEFMIALVCKLLDKKFETIFIIMNDNTELESQNFKRFLKCSEIFTSPKSAFDICNMEISELKEGMQRVIFCRKNSQNLKNLLNASRFMKKRVIIDDEADYASPDSNINRIDKEATKINELVGKLINFHNDGIYIGVTATPGRLDVNNTFMNKAKDWVFLDPHKRYKGKDFFFPTNEKKIKLYNPNYKLVKLPEEGDDPKFINEAIIRFILRVAYINLTQESNELIPMSMLIHTSGIMNDHERDKKDVDKFLNILSQDLKNVKTQKMYENLNKICEELFNNGEFENNKIKSKDILKFIYRNKSRSQVLLINSKQHKQNVDMSCNPVSLFTFAIGGNIVSRGLTFNNLLSFFFSRSVKGKLQQNTYIQRARMFGTREHIKHFELCIPETLFTDWTHCFLDHELSLKLAKSGTYTHVQSKRTSIAPSSSIDKKHVFSTPDKETQVGEIFSLDNRIIERLSQNTDAVTIIQSLKLDGLINEENFHKAFLEYLLEEADEDKSNIGIVLGKDNGILDIGKFKDADIENIRRARGGMIQATIHKRDKFNKYNHLIMPVKNINDKCRFYYKGFVSKSLMENILNRQKNI